ncbi:MAG: Gfo/Idh/MocA family oxidoreductase [Pirellulaceae bacterium]|nr:Gfo/Idh/MocA family oxidoreductase [Pirellulaceae bacterium]
MAMNRWGFLGTGRVTHRMVEAVRQAREAQLSGIASRDLDRAKAWANDRSSESTRPDDEAIRAYDGYRSLIDDEAIDWVYVALPPSLHREWTIAALKAGKNVLCEKPLCLNAHDAAEMAEAAERYKKRLCHATAFPFHPRSQAARAVIQSGELGAIRRVHVACSFSGILTRGDDHRTDPTLGGGCLLDLGWYCVYSTKWFTGLDCVRLQALGSKSNGAWNQVQVIAELSDRTLGLRIRRRTATMDRDRRNRFVVDLR